MLAVYAEQISRDAPLDGLRIGEQPDPTVPSGWTTVQVRAASLNHHDIWSLRGVGLPSERLPMILGCDAAGIDESGDPVVVHSLLGDPDWRADETLDPSRTMLSEMHPGTFAERVAVPRRNLVPLPPSLPFIDAACLPTAWLTAYAMLFRKAELKPGETVLIQGASGGVATAAIMLARHAGVRVWVTSRDEAKLQQACELGAHATFAVGERLPERVQAVLETVGQATWAHSLRALRPGGIIVVSGATSGDAPPGELTRVFFQQLRVTGSTMGTLDDLRRLVQFIDSCGIKPPVDRVLPMTQAREGFEAMLAGQLFGKIVLTTG
jgi:NADPH:quinone reductase-like Zn-dependent oxidoreductase